MVADGGLDRLGVDDRGGRLRLTAGRDPALAAQFAVHRFGGAQSCQWSSTAQTVTKGGKSAGLARRQMPSLTR